MWKSKVFMMAEPLVMIRRAESNMKTYLNANKQTIILFQDKTTPHFINIFKLLIIFYYQWKDMGGKNVYSHKQTITQKQCHLSLPPTLPLPNISNSKNIVKNSVILFLHLILANLSKMLWNKRLKRWAKSKTYLKSAHMYFSRAWIVWWKANKKNKITLVLQVELPLLKLLWEIDCKK